MELTKAEQRTRTNPWPKETKMRNDIFKLVGEQVTARNIEGAELKAGKLTCIDAGRDTYRITAADDRGLEGFNFSGCGVDRVERNTLFFKPFV